MNTSRKRTAERQRNLWLFLGQFSFLVLVNQGDVVSLEVCEIFGAVTHLAWMLFWSWTGIDIVIDNMMGFLLLQELRVTSCCTPSQEFSRQELFTH